MIAPTIAPIHIPAIAPALRVAAGSVGVVVDVGSGVDVDSTGVAVVEGPADDVDRDDVVLSTASSVDCQRISIPRPLMIGFSTYVLLSESTPRPDSAVLGRELAWVAGIR